MPDHVTISEPVQEANPGSRFLKKTISLPAELAAAAEKRAGEEQRNFSNYVQSLITRDLRSAGDVAAA